MILNLCWLGRNHGLAWENQVVDNLILQLRGKIALEIVASHNKLLGGGQTELDI